MIELLRSFGKALRRLLRSDPGVQFGGADVRLPPVMPPQWHSAYLLSQAYRRSTWYFERNFERHLTPGRGDWPDSKGR